MNTSPMPLQRDPGTTLHRQLFLVLRGQISDGVYPRGGAIPAEDELCAQFGVSRITVRRAIADLEATGVIEKRRGLGTFVADRPGVSRSQPRLGGLVAALSKTARETDVQVLQVELVVAPAAVRTQLELHDDARTVHAVRLRSQRDVPVLVTEAWVPERFAGSVTESALKTKALFEILMAAGVKFGRVVQEVTAMAADPRLSRLFRTQVGAPLLRVTRLMYDVRKSPVQYITIHSSPDRSRLLMDYSASAVNTVGTGRFVHEVD